MKNCIKIAAIISISLLVFSSCAEMAKLDQKLKQGSVDKVSRMNNFDVCYGLYNPRANAGLTSLGDPFVNISKEIFSNEVYKRNIDCMPMLDNIYKRAEADARARASSERSLTEGAEMMDCGYVGCYADRAEKNSNSSIKQIDTRCTYDAYGNANCSSTSY